MKKFYTRFLVMMLFTGSLSATPVLSQRASLNVAFEGKMLIEVLDHLKSATGMGFTYNKSQVDETQRVSASFSQATLEQVLDKVLVENGLNYEIDGRVVYVTPARAEAQQPPARQAQVAAGGTVIDQNGAPMAGASIVVKGSAGGVSADQQGRFQIVVPAGSTLVFMYVGYKTDERPAAAGMRVVMQQNTQLLDAVRVPTGLMDIDKRNFTGTSTEVTREQIKMVNANNLVSALSVFDPSLRIAVNNEMGSDPNTLPEFYLRGRSGLSGVSQLDMIEAQEGGDISRYGLQSNTNLPLFILDGSEVTYQTIYDMDVNRIESITILKDAAATAFYGSRASNGIVVIETVAPQAGQLRITYNFNASVTAPDLSAYNLTNAREHLEADVAAGLIDFHNPKEGDLKTYYERLEYYNNVVTNIAQGVDTYWLSQPLQTQFNHRHSLYLEGGENTVRFGVGLNLDSQNGVMKESYRRRLGADFKIDYRLKSALQVTNMVSFSMTNNQNSPYGSFADYSKQLPYFSPWDLTTGQLRRELETPIGFNGNTPNPLYEATVGNFSRGRIGSIRDNLTIDAFFLRKFRFRTTAALGYEVNGTRNFTSPTSVTQNLALSEDLFDVGRLNVGRTETFNWDINSMLSYNTSLAAHHINVTAGVNANQSEARSEAVEYRGFASPSMADEKYAKKIFGEKPSVYTSSSRLFGAYLSGNYTWNDIYLADISVRTDGSSDVGSENHFATFWAVGGGVNFHNYDFAKQLKWLDKARVTANYGLTGKNSLPESASRHTYKMILDQWYPTGIGSTLNAMGNPNLKWESSKKLNIGGEVGVFGRVSAQFNWYDTRTDNLISAMTIPSSTGFNSYYENVGKVMNRGWELQLSGRVVKTQDWDFNVIVRAGHNKNQIVEISDAMREYNDRVAAYYENYWTSIEDRKNVKYSRPITMYVEGGSESSIFGMQSLGISPATGQELFVKRDGTVTYEWSAQEQQIIGSIEPKVNGSLSFNLRYKNWTLFTSFLYNFGGQAYNSTLVNLVENVDVWQRNVDRRVASDRWRQPGDVASFKDIADRYNTTRPTSRFVQKDNNLSFNSLSLNYELEPKLVRRLGMSRISVAASMNDVAYWSTIKRERGLSYPYARTFNLSLNASF